MIFLIEYNRGEGRLITFRKFDEAQQREANDARLTLELELNRKRIEHEVVLLEAENEDAIRRTHRRYFETLRELLEDGARVVSEKTAAKGA